MPFRGDLSVIRLFLAGDHAKERRLARAVRPDKADLFTLVEDGRSLDEKETVAVLLADIFNADHVDEGPGLLLRRPYGMARDRPTQVLIDDAARGPRQGP